MEIKLFSLKETSNPDVFRYINLNGDWTHYYIKSKNLYVPAVNHILKLGFPKGLGFYNYLLGVNKEEAKRILEEAGEKGSRVHDVIKNLIEGRKITYQALYPNSLTGRPEPISLEEWQSLLSFQSFVNYHKVEVIMSENSVATDQYAGTIDFVGMMDWKGKKVKVLLDWKTSGAIYDDYKLQVAAYWRALEDKEIQYTGVIRLGTKHKNGHIDNAGYEVKLWDIKETLNHYKAFESAINIYNLNNSEFELDESVMPVEIQVNIPKYQSVKKPNMPKVNKAKKAMSKRATGEITSASE